MLQAAAIGFACLGSWTFFPPTIDGVGFNVSLGKDSDYEMFFTDYSRVKGRWNRNSDSSFDLFENGEKIATLRNCGDAAAEVELFDTVATPKTFAATRFQGDFATEARERGFFHGDGEDEGDGEGEDVSEAPVSSWRNRTFARWTVTRLGNAPYFYCEMALRDHSFYLRSLPGNGALAIEVSTATPMSNLRATTSDYRVRIGMVFDGDVAIFSVGDRIGRKIVGTNFPDDQQLLRYMSAASRVTVSATYNVLGSFDLRGSSEAVTGLRACIAS